MEFLALLGKRRSVTAAVALLVAFAAGFFMQHVLVDETPLATVDGLPDAAPTLRAAEQTPTLPTPPAATLIPVLPAPPVMPDRVKTPESDPLEVWDDARLSPFGFNCEPQLTLSRRDAAMLNVEFFAPCDQGQTVTFRHGALEVDLVTDPYGRVRLTLPALEVSAIVTAALEKRSVESRTLVSDALSFSRVILVWEGEQLLHIHAYEFGASRGEVGHIRAERSKTAARAMRGTGGFLVSVGDGSGHAAQIYTFPTGHSPLKGMVELTVEARVTDQTCSRLAQATTLQPSPLGGMTKTDVRVTLPDCSRVGDVMELKNLLQDMRLAGR